MLAGGDYCILVYLCAFLGVGQSTHDRQYLTMSDQELGGSGTLIRAICSRGHAPGTIAPMLTYLQ
jgi:hypothetical protein